ncbi:MAG: hypothetical protein R3Y51_05535 [Rikenellaceae bacterium]
MEIARQRNSFIANQNNNTASSNLQSSPNNRTSQNDIEPSVEKQIDEDSPNDQPTEIRFKEDKTKAPLQNSDALSNSSPLDGTVHGTPGVSNDHEVAGAPVPNASVSNVNSTKVQNKINKAKQNIENSLKRINNIGIANNFRTLSVLADILGMDSRKGSKYAQYTTPKGTVTIRLSDHKANGNNFNQNQSDNNLSIVIEKHYTTQPSSNVPYTEFIYPIAKNTNEYRSIIKSILNGVSSVLDGNEYIDESGKAQKIEVTPNDIRFKQDKALALEAVNDQFNTELQNQIDNGTPQQGHVYHLGYPSEVLSSTGIPNLPIELNATILAKKASADYKSNHPFDLNDVKDLPKAIANPIAVFESNTVKGSKVIFTELKSNGVNFVVALEVNAERKGLDSKISVNSIRSLYPKDHIQSVINWINSKDNLLLYANKEKALDWLVQQPSYSADVNSPIKGLDSATKVIENFENPKSNATIFHKEAIDQEAELQNSETPNQPTNIRFKEDKTKAPLQNSDALNNNLSTLSDDLPENPARGNDSKTYGSSHSVSTASKNSAKLKKKTLHQRLKQKKVLYA